MNFHENDLVMVREDINRDTFYEGVYYGRHMHKPGEIVRVKHVYPLANYVKYDLGDGFWYAGSMLVSAPSEIVDGYCGEDALCCSKCGIGVNPNSKYTVMTEDGKVFCCNVCANESGYFKCKNCGAWTSEGECAIDGSYFCNQECAEESGYARCTECGDLVNRDDAVYVDEENDVIYCSPECASRNGYLRCDDCGEYYHESEMNINDCQVICCNCWDYHDYVRCDGCGDFIRSDDSYGDDGYYCEHCWEEMEESEDSDIIREYHDGPGIYFNGNMQWYSMSEEQKNKVYYGLEIETDDGNSRDCYAEELYDISHEETLFFMEGDGSLDYGVEIISQPMDWEHVKTFPFEEIHRIARKNGFKSHDTRTCGLHIHFSRQPFSENMELFEAKLVYYFEKFEDEIESIARRKYGQWCEGFKITNNDGKPGTTDEMINKLEYLKGGHGDRYHAVNLTNEDTIEIRVFKGTLNESTLLASVEFVKLATEYVNTHTVLDIQNTDFLSTMEGMSDNLNDYLVTRGVKKSENTMEDNKEEIVCA